MAEPILLFLGTPDDREYLPKLKGAVGSASVFVITEPIHTIIEVILYCKKRNITGVVSTSVPLLSKLLGLTGERKQPSLDSYAGSYFIRDGIEFVFINPLDHLVKVPYGKFLAQRFISKLSSPQNWNPSSAFNWELVNASNADKIFQEYQKAFAIACDIETFSTPPSIRCISFTAIYIDGDGLDSIRTHTCVIPVDSEWALSWVRKFCDLPAPKIFQRGKYDISYLSRFNAVPYNYLWDTAVIMHCWYSELPKDLAFLNAFFVRNAMYWKDLANTTDLMEYYRYNALDTWATANVWIAQMLEMPQWARTNYLIEFPLIFPCHMAEMIGVRRDFDALKRARTEIDSALTTEKAALDRMLAVQGFNVNSPPQMKALLKILGCQDLGSADEKHLAKAAFRHPLNARIIEKITGVPDSPHLNEMGIRGLRKLKSTYLRTDDDITKTSKGGAKEFGGRILYALNPDGTDTVRLASREHHFWCGLQFQNIPRGRSVKQTITSDKDFLFAECDSAQAETRDTAFISGDAKLIAAVSGTRDFHSLNTSAFFGVPYDTVYDDARHKTLNKILRDLAKRVNHGANYNMGPDVLVDTMGLTKIYEAQRLLGLNRYWTPRQIAEYLLAQFHKTYPAISGSYYPSVVHAVSTTHLLVGATGWTRYCFSNPNLSAGGNKRALNAYVAHCPQSLNACRLNLAWQAVFYKIALNPEINSPSQINFKLCAQIHDSILFQFRIGHHHLIQEVRKLMEIPITVKGCDGVVRTYVVPADVKAGPNGMGMRYWSELE